MKRKKQKKGEKKSRWTLIPVLLIVVIAAAVIVTVFYLGQDNQGQPNEPEHKEAKDYFDIINATVDEGVFPYPDESVVIVYQMSFLLKATGGDATYVVANYLGYYHGEVVDLGNMTKGEVRWVQLTFSASVAPLIEREEKGYPIRIPIFCEEAKGVIIVYL